MHSEKRNARGRESALVARAIGTGRWALLEAPPALSTDDVLEARARQYVEGYGIVFARSCSASPAPRLA